jgi:polycystin 1L2
MKEMNGFKGFVGYGIRELSFEEINIYCDKKSQNISMDFPRIDTQVNFTSDFMIRAYSSGCYYYDTNTGKWNSDGMDIYEDTNLQQTRCLTNHLTSFAGGLVLLPSSINFQYVFENASFTKNPLIYSSVILITCLYILCAIWCHYMDKYDAKKMNIIPLKDNHPSDTYFYEFMVFTGNRSESGTQSKIYFTLNGENNETDIRCLNDVENSKQLLQRSSVDSFLMSVSK